MAGAGRGSNLPGPRRPRAADWTIREVNTLREGIAARVPLRELHASGALRPHRSLAAVRAKAHVLGLSLRRLDEEYPPGTGWPVQFRCARAMHRWIGGQAAALRGSPAAVVRQAIAAAMRGEPTVNDDDAIEIEVTLPAADEAAAVVREPSGAARLPRICDPGFDPRAASRDRPRRLAAPVPRVTH